MLRPCRATANKNISSARSSAVIDRGTVHAGAAAVLARSPNDERIPADGDRGSKSILTRRVEHRWLQVGLLRPRRTISDKHVGCAGTGSRLIGIAIHTRSAAVLTGSSDDDRIPTDRHRRAEKIPRICGSCRVRLQVSLAGDRVDRQWVGGAGLGHAQDQPTFRGDHKAGGQYLLARVPNLQSGIMNDRRSASILKNDRFAI